LTPRKPRLTAREIIRVIERKGFTLARQSGSHRIFKNAEGRRVTVPVHGSMVLHPKVLASILRDAEIDWDELSELLK
jgi:predicted RNA binding protein YcfA (HicA-like mRNA interferase family)